MNQHPRTDEDRRVALSWIGRQLAWENRLETLRDDPDPNERGEHDERENADADEVNPAA